MNHSHKTPSPNHLVQETSPYLLQHALNPVDWYPWGSQALELARQLNRPILLSIGYSSCHWCHVMAHESFEDEETAALMNAYYVNIKVDREERPDLDRIYQTAHALLTERSGGWPLTLFLDPSDQTPFFCGTYFPSEARHGLPAFKELLIRVSGVFRTQRAELIRQNGYLRTALIGEYGIWETTTNSLEEGPGFGGTKLTEPEPLNAEPLNIARHQLQKNFDSYHGGFYQPPKFPHPTYLERLMRHYALSWRTRQPDVRALEMVNATLTAMARGGIYDHLGGGFCRYSVDAQWMIPHFEKMLYDNGPLLALYADAWVLTDDPLYRRTVEETAAWAIREMQSPLGGYWSSLDADSEGEEGRFYLWTREEVAALLTNPQEYSLLAAAFGLDRRPNFEGRWHLHGYRTSAELAQMWEGVESRPNGVPESEEETQAILDAARAKLFAAREPRERPGRDEKILTAWNALMIRGMAVAARRLMRPDYVTAAERALDFLRANLWQDGRLFATWKEGRARHNAYLDDYAFLLDALLALLQVRWRGADLDFAVEIAEVLLAHFADSAGGFWFTSDDHESLIYRPKPMADESLPAGNGIAALALGRLGHLLGESRYLAASEETLRAARTSLEKIPNAHCALLHALEEYLYPPEIVILRGEPESLAFWMARTAHQYTPRRLIFAIPSITSDLPAALSIRVPHATTVAYICTGSVCAAPITDPDILEAVLTSMSDLSG
ncbi:Thioredoxin domain-containing protein [Gammaproteobacteria bacterium]